MTSIREGDIAISRDRISALFFLALSIAYYVLARNIEVFAGDDEQLIDARTFPKFIGTVGTVIAFLMLVLPARGAERKIPWASFDWSRAALLCALMVVYGLTIKWPGFFLATAGFLGAGCIVLGERRPWVLLLVALPVAAGFEAVLSGFLRIYIEDPFVTMIVTYIVEPLFTMLGINGS